MKHYRFEYEGRVMLVKAASENEARTIAGIHGPGWLKAYCIETDQTIEDNRVIVFLK